MVIRLARGYPCMLSYDGWCRGASEVATGGVLGNVSFAGYLGVDAELPMESRLVVSLAPVPTSEHLVHEG